MLRKRVIASLLAIAVLCCAFLFSASAENEQCEITLAVDGRGTVLLNGATVSPGTTSYVDPDTTVTLTAEPAANYEFLFWQNHETSKVVSWEPSYTFTAATYALYDAVFTRVQDGHHIVIYLTQGENVVFCQPVPMDDTYYYDSVPTSGMTVSGKVWTGWDKTKEEVAEQEGLVIVHPLYNTDKTFTINAIINGTTTTYEKLYLSRQTLNAPSQQNGESFSYWRAKAKDVNSVDEIASFYRQYEFVVTGDVTLEAVYGETVDIGVTTRISGDLPSFNEGTIMIAAERSVTTAYTVIQHGILVTKDMQIGSSDSLFVIPQSQSDDNPIYKYTSTNTQRAGSYRVNLYGWYSESIGSHEEFPRIFARPYIIVRDGSGVTQTIYGARYCVDHVLETGTGGGDNYDDPFG